MPLFPTSFPHALPPFPTWFARSRRFVRMFHVKHRFVLFRVKAFSRGVVRKVRLGMAGALVYSEMDTIVKREGTAC